MKKFLLILVFLVSLPVIGAEKQFGIGLAGSNIISGLSGKYFLDTHSAIQGVVGSRGGYGFATNIDYIIEFPPYLVENKDVTLTWYAGGGAFWWHSDYDDIDDTWETFGINGVVGLSLKLQKVPLEFTLEWRPAFFISSSYYKNHNYDGLYLNGMGGAIRWYF